MWKDLEVGQNLEKGQDQILGNVRDRSLGKDQEVCLNQERIRKIVKDHDHGDERDQDGDQGQDQGRDQKKDHYLLEGISVALALSTFDMSTMIINDIFCILYQRR